MCIAIWKLDDKAEATGDYSLVLAFNRDEYFDRPTRGFHIWESKPNICAPLDLKPTDEAHRGSWIGVNRKGRLAFLTNFRELVPHHDGKISRGALVRDFLLDDLVTPGGQHVQTHSSNRDTVIEYAEKVYNERELYDGFNLVLFDLLSEHKTAVYVSNRGQNEDGSRGSMCELDQGQVIGLSNSTIDNPWPKVSRGCDRFAHTLSGLRSFANNDEQDTHTIAALLDALRDSSPFSNVDDADVPQKIEDLAQCVFVPRLHGDVSSLGEESYGTRTTNVLLLRNNQLTISECNYKKNGNHSTDRTTSATVLYFSFE
ncbi:hypothetical protein GGH19_002487 [Coemansia sp. RSA 1807]|nr:hypothetical protein LPJ62_001048 [Coemansia sp. RSA 2167]KAJ2151686.1 hypothetical protein J3F82_003180 [Coemansia sp. RSA 637]KAJ2221808.1 hypothetical protein EV180_004528 [Coemansia sp. RSA 518]KAJ2246136.1 hypothetical protein GGH97_002588 [Coemansia sp. RSA 475]KAJ2279832.1 hypothetical protein EV176_001327 [Coemansia sp. RSA 451]KAJ2436341.1 hypothetical protein IWW41_000277 [Coemansia sp. RSA 2522]KAJ2532621.1 hypothetical protein IWW43_003089 [Coemansia sp. RSA 1935]KAJ2533091.1 